MALVGRADHLADREEREPKVPRFWRGDVEATMKPYENDKVILIEFRERPMSGDGSDGKGDRVARLSLRVAGESNPPALRQQFVADVEKLMHRYLGEYMRHIQQRLVNANAEPGTEPRDA